MKKIYLNPFAALVNKKSDRSLVKAIVGIVDSNDAPFWYSRIRSGVRRFFAEGLNDDILESLVNTLEGVVPTTTFQKKDCENSKLAVRKIQEMSFEKIEGKNLVPPIVKTVLFYGIELVINPDALFFWMDDTGQNHVGVIKTKLKKSAFRQEEATMIACLLKHYLLSLYPDYIVEEEFCICYDAFRSRFYTAVNYTKNIVFATSLAERIAIMDHYAA